MTDALTAIHHELQAIASGIFWVNVWLFVIMVVVIIIDGRIYRNGKKARKQREEIIKLLSSAAAQNQRPSIRFRAKESERPRSTLASR